MGQTAAEMIVYCCAVDRDSRTHPGQFSFGGGEAQVSVVGENSQRRGAAMHRLPVTGGVSRRHTCQHTAQHTAQHSTPVNKQHSTHHQHSTADTPDNRRKCRHISQHTPEPTLLNAHQNRHTCQRPPEPTHPSHTADRHTRQHITTNQGALSLMPFYGLTRL